jgi:hypothetical protein
LDFIFLYWNFLFSKCFNKIMIENGREKRKI